MCTKTVSGPAAARTALRSQVSTRPPHRTCRAVYWVRNQYTAMEVTSQRTIVRAGRKEGEEHGVQRRDAARKHDGLLTALECRELFLQVQLIGARLARVQDRVRARPIDRGRVVRELV